MRLRKGERNKFQRQGHTDSETGVSLTGDDIIGSIIGRNMALLPISVSPHGHLGSIIERFLYDKDPVPLLEDDFMDGAVQAAAAARVAISPKVPHGLLPRADKIWRATHPTSPYSGSHHATSPSRHFDQELGLVISTAISSHLLRAYDKNAKLRPLECTCHESPCRAFQSHDLLQLGPVLDEKPVFCTVKTGPSVGPDLNGSCAQLKPDPPQNWTVDNLS